MNKQQIRRIALRALVASIRHRESFNNPADKKRLEDDRATLQILILEELDEHIEVHVSGGVADCDDDRVIIIDHDNLDEEAEEARLYGAQ